MATYYLNADTGANGNPGTAALPWETIAYGVATSASGDTLFLQNATAPYTFATVDTKSTTYQGQSVLGVTVNSAAGTQLIRSNVDFLLQDLTYDAQGTGDIEFRAATGSNSTLTFRRCFFVGTVPTTDGVINISAVGFVGSTVTIQACIFKDMVFNVAGVNVFIRTNNGLNGITVNLYNNTFYFSGDYVEAAVFYTVGNAGIVINMKNNIFFNDDGGSPAQVGTPSNATINYDYNCAYNMSDVPAGGTGNITDDPLFVDQGSDNFNLRPTSPCIDTGTLI